MGKYKSGGFFWDRIVYQSEAYLSLGKNSMKFLNALHDVRQTEKPGKAKDKKGRKRKIRFVNLDRLEMPYKTLQKKYGVNQQGTTRAIDELLAKGFIKITHHGGLGEHDKNRYALIDDYLSWRPGMKPIRQRKRDVRRGYQGKCLGASKNKTRSQNVTPIHA